MSKRSCLVTGGNGFIGSHLAQALATGGWNVRVLLRSQTSALRFASSEGISVVEGDFGNKEAAKRALEGVDTLFHFASTTLPATAYRNSIPDVTHNLVGTLNLLDEAVTQGCTRVVFPSSGGTVYGVPSHCPISESHLTQPICSHGIVKLAIENYLHLMSLEQNLHYTILRYANPYGPRQRSKKVQGAVAVFADRILREEPIEIWGDGAVVRDFVYIDDAIEATLLATSSVKSVNQVFNVGCGAGISLIELIAMIEELTERKAIVRFGPPRPFDVPINILSIEKAKAEFAWSPRHSLREGLLKTIEAILTAS